jgi:AAA-like domain
MKTDLTIEEALTIMDMIIAPERLSTIQELVFRQCWAGQTYQEIADSCGYDTDYIRVVGSRLWQLISNAFGEKVTKNNIRAVVRDCSRQVQKSSFAVDNSKPLNRTEVSSAYQKQISPLEFPGSPLSLNSPFYVHRDVIEERCYEEIGKPEALIRIKAPEKWGKTSLIQRILAYAKLQDYQTVCLNFQKVDSDALVNLDRFLRWFCANITQQLGLEPRLDEYWDSDLGSKVSCTTYLQEYILTQVENPLVIAMDEVHRLFEYPVIAQDFLPLLRVWHEEANNLDIWAKLRLVVTYSTEIYIPLDLNQSPFNVGLPIRLDKFDLEQTQDFAFRHGLSISDSEFGLQDLVRLRAMVDGHPYLLHLALYHIFYQEVTIKHLLEDALTQIGIYQDHLRSYLSKLQKSPNIAEVFKEIVMADKAVPLEVISAYKLESMGLVNLHGDMATLSCDLYRLYFRDRLNQF